MSANLLLEELKAAGLTVKQLSGWKTRGGSWAEGGEPVGIMEHHTAPPVPYPPDRLITGGQIKANMNTKPDGTVWMIAYQACNYSSGSGSSHVLKDVRECRSPSKNAAQRNLSDDMGGNQFFWNFENDHAGDGSILPNEQLEAIVVASRVVADHFGLSHCNTISHAEWTSRKIDPRWNGSNRTAIEQIREGMQVAMLGPNGEPNWDEVSDWAKDAWTWAWIRDDRITSKDSHPLDTMTKQELMSHLKRAFGE